MKDDWCKTTIKQISHIYPGYGFPKIFQGKRTGEYPFFKVSDISKNVKLGNIYLKECKNYIKHDAISKIKGKLLPPNTIVFAKIGEALKLNRRAITKAYSLIDNNTIGIKANDEIVTNLFLFYYLKTVKLENYSRATTVPSVRKTDIENISIFTPPLPEQRAIVAKIEGLFSALDSGVAELKAAKDKLEIYRQAVLKKAFEGEFVFRALKEVCEKIQDGSHYSPKIQTKVRKHGMYLYITSKNIRNNKMLLDNVTYVDKSFHESIYKRCNPKYEDVLLTKDGVNTGNVTLNTLKEPFSLLSSVCLIRPNKDILLPSFVKYYIQSPVGFKELTGKMTGTAIRRIILKRIKNAEIPIPDLVVQKQIVQEIETRLSVCDKIMVTIDESLEQAEALRQSILKKAFEGELLSESELESCRKEPDWEPAEKLLERIKKEKKKP